MVIGTAATLALYCPRCGKIQKHDISRFALRDSVRIDLACSCGQIQATLTACRHQYLLNIPCLVCQMNHIISLNKKKFWHTNFEKIYCARENLEMGFIGQKEKIEQKIADHKREFDSMVHELDVDDYGEYIENPPVLLEILNRVHDIAERGHIVCHCGKSAVEINLLPDGIELSCAHCGSHKIIEARREQDLAYIASLEKIELVAERRSHQKH
ncbi:hypothetical protein SDC9_22936 [bioreactor metagenome]|uniref:Uncharacterized protein n=1 Tax=bioreactor metagenome TaxID=1076179 RepID=A0A644UDL8_9ZZZZ|nr:hypothetical protein [Negativicutes bacterium]